MSDFVKEYSRQCDLMMASIRAHVSVGLYYDMVLDYRPGRRWGKTSRSRARRWASWIRRRNKAQLPLKMNTARFIGDERFESRMAERVKL